MKNFTYYRPKSVHEASLLLEKKWGTAELLAGGTDLLDLTKEYVAQPEKVVSLSGVEGLVKIDVAEKNPPIIKIGAGATLASIAAHPAIKQYCAALATAAGEAGTPQIRNVGTIGGNLCQRNRCWYFRDEGIQCLIKGGEKCFALDGENRYHSIFTKGQKCVCVSPSTLAPALIALGASVEMAEAVDENKGKGGGMPVELFFQAPTATQREHRLSPNGVVTGVTIETKKNLRSASYEVRHKQAYDWPLTQACAAFELDGDKAKNVRIALGHVAPTPILSTDAAQALEGKAVSEETAAAAGEAAAKGANPLSQNAYKVKLLAVAVKRAILTAAGKKRYWEV